MRNGLLVVMVLIAAMMVGCSTPDPIAGTWEGTITLRDVQQNEETSAIKLVLENDKGIITGKVTATGFGWQDKVISTGAYVESTKGFAVTVDVGGNDVQLMLVGRLVTDSRLSGDAATGAAMPRIGTWSVDLK